MADEEIIEFKFTNSAGEDMESCETYSGEGVANYSNGDTYNGNFLEGVNL